MTQATADLHANPMLASEGLPRFDAIQPEHVEPAMSKVLADAEAALESLESKLSDDWSPDYDDLFDALEAMDRPFERSWRAVEHLLAVKNTDELRDAHEKLQPNVVQLGLKMAQSRPIYEALEKLKATADFPNWPEAKQRAVTIRLRDAIHAGVGLEGEKRERFNAIAQEMSKLSTDFSNHVLDATKAFELIVEDPADTEGWPMTLKRGASQSYNLAQAAKQAKEGNGDTSPQKSTPDAGPWRITLDYPSFVPFMQHARRRDQREGLYRAFVTRASEGKLDNSEIILKELKLRKEQAGLLGFANYAEWSLDSKMAPSVEAVIKMEQELYDASYPHGEQDLKDIEALAKESGFEGELALWDVGFWAERLREKRFDYTDEELRPYFPMPRVLDGLFALCEKLFGITVERADEDAPRWHDDVRYYYVRDESGKRIAAFYLDPYSRPAEKRGGAWMNECLHDRGNGKLPVVHLICNGTPPVGDPEGDGTPSLMSFDEVLTLFHEAGHGLQDMLSTQQVNAVSGLNGIEWDAIEIASQFMENWVYHKPTLLGMTQHVETGEPLPDALFDKIVKARTYRAGTQMLRQHSLGMVDLELHSSYDPDSPADGETPFDVDRRITKRCSFIPPLPEAKALCSFAHIFAGSYAAGYYSYKWSEVLSADVFAAFEEVGLDNNLEVEVLGRKYRDTFLALGGGRDPMAVFKDFRNREPSTEALLRHQGLTGKPAE